MPRIRSIKPEFWADEKLARVSRDARLLLVGMLNFADDQGRLRGNHLLVRAQIFPYDSDLDVDQLLTSLEIGGFISRYQAKGECFISIINFTKHQKLDHPKQSQLPDPPAIREKSLQAARPTRNISQDQGGDQGGDQGQETTLSASQPTGQVLALLSPPAPRPPKGKAVDAVRVVFEHWRAVHRKDVRTLLDGPRRRAIEKQLREGRTTEELCRAVEGCAKDAFSMGQNDRSQKYNDIALICRDAERVEKFMALSPRATGPPGPRRKTEAEIMAEVDAEFEAKNGKV